MPTVSAGDPARAHEPDHDHDACLCDCAAEAHEETGDHDLPEATGGVAKTAGAKREAA